MSTEAHAPSFLRMRVWRLAALAALLVASPAPAQPEGGAYADWALMLGRYVTGDHVDYVRWKTDNPAEWRRFLEWLERTDPSKLPLADQRAFWINAYNARLVASVVSRYPVDSVRDVGYLGGRFRGFFSRREHPVAGRTRSLEEIRRIVTRPPLGDPRAHFAMSFAAESSPPLRAEPYLGATLDTQLDFQARTFLNGPRGHRYERGDRRLYLTSILRWYEDDFRREAGSVRAFAARFLMGPVSDAASGGNVAIEWLPFDWRLDQAH